MEGRMRAKTILIFLCFAYFVTACGGAPSGSEPTEPTVTPDPCAPENLQAEVIKVNKLMREFDDYAELASNTVQGQLIQVIPEMQRILRDAEDQPAPACLVELKRLQIAHMNVVVQTLMAFMGNADAQQVSAGIGQAQQLHNEYDVEMARLLGVTLVAPSTVTPLSIPPTTQATP
jgi:hypothetical protein